MKYLLFPLLLISLILAACSPTTETSPTPTNTPSPIPSTTPSPTTRPVSKSAANADVLFVQAEQSEDGTWTFEVTVAHPDTGWDDYADGWDVVLPDGTVAKTPASSPFTRLLAHPHEQEQPFTRNQSGIIIPEGITQVTVRAHDLVDGFGGKEVLVDLTQTSGTNFKVVPLAP